MKNINQHQPADHFIGRCGAWSTVNAAGLVIIMIVVAASPVIFAADTLINNPVIVTNPAGWKYKAGKKSASIKGKGVTPDLAAYLTSRWGRIGIARVEHGTNYAFVPCYPLVTKNSKSWSLNVKKSIKMQYRAKNSSFTCTVWTQLPPVWAVYIDTNPVANPSMVLIPGGEFQYGNCMDPGEAFWIEVPHSITVTVRSFYVEKTEVTLRLWQEVYAWAIANGYKFDAAGSGKDMNHPVHSVTWYDCVKWCNARSEKERLTPCYYTTPTHSTVYKKGSPDILDTNVKWTANGYRLPNLYEWEKAARGGTPGHRFPWSSTDTITHDQANYYSTTNNSYDMSLTRGFHPLFTGGLWGLLGDYPYTSPVGYFAPNGYGLYDMAGNISEWCFGICGNSGGYRLAYCRGGHWYDAAEILRCSAIDYENAELPEYGKFGFRCFSGM